jgi:hypothetical protein
MELLKWKGEGGLRGKNLEENEPNKKGVSKPSIARRGPKASTNLLL